MKNLLQNKDGDILTNYVKRVETMKPKIEMMLGSPGYCLLHDFADTKIFAFTRPQYISEVNSLPEGLEIVTDPGELAKCKAHFERVNY